MLMFHLKFSSLLLSIGIHCHFLFRYFLELSRQLLALKAVSCVPYHTIITQRGVVWYGTSMIVLWYHTIVVIVRTHYGIVCIGI
jgi:hypothetical protein